MKKALAVAGTVVVVAALLAFGALKWWNVLGQSKLGGPCSGRAGCLSYQCLKHALRGGAEVVVDGYCTAPCERDEECAAAGLKCVTPSPAALDDLPSLGRPAKLCQRFE